MMAAKPIAMEQLKQVLNLYSEGQSIKAIVRLTGLSRNTVRAYVAKGSATACDPATHNDSEALYNQDTVHLKSVRYQQLVNHLEAADKELAKPGVTRQLLWREYLDTSNKITNPFMYVSLKKRLSSAEIFRRFKKEQSGPKTIL